MTIISRQPYKFVFFYHIKLIDNKPNEKKIIKNNHKQHAAIAAVPNASHDVMCSSCFEILRSI